MASHKLRSTEYREYWTAMDALFGGWPYTEPTYERHDCLFGCLAAVRLFCLCLSVATTIGFWLQVLRTLAEISSS